MDDALSFVGGQLNAYDLSGLNAVIRGASSDYNVFSFKELVMKTIRGELDLSAGSIVDSVSQMFFNEIAYNSKLIINLFVVVLMSAVLANLTESFKTKSGGEIGFYVSYIAVVSILFSSFNLAVGITVSLITDLSSAMQSVLPLMMGLIAVSGNFTGAYIINSFMLLMINWVTVIIKTVVVPAVVMGASLQIVNFIMRKDMLLHLSNVIKSGCNYALKGLAFLFLSILSLQRISTPILNNIVAKTAKATVMAVPVVGGIMNGALDTVIVWSQAARSGVLVALLIAIVIICALPLIKVFAILVIFKLTSALVQPICDDRIIKCIDSAGTFLALVLNCGITVAVMFVISVMIILSF